MGVRSLRALVLLATVFARGIRTEPELEANQQRTQQPHVRQIIEKWCRTKYTSICMKLDLLRLVGVLGRSSPGFNVLPGVRISSAAYRQPLEPTQDVVEAALAGNMTLLDSHLRTSLKNYLKSLTLTVSVYNQEALEFVETTAKQEQLQETGRTKKFKFLSIYTVFAIAFALLSGLVGKAMTLSIVSLIIAMLARNAGGANSPPFGTAPVSFDIVRRPQVQFTNTHTAEDVYDAPSYLVHRGSTK